MIIVFNFLLFLDYIIRYQGTLLLLLLLLLFLFSFEKNSDSKIELNKQKKNFKRILSCTRFARIWISVLVCSCVCVCMCFSVSVSVWVLAFALLFFCWSYLLKDYKCIFSLDNFFQKLPPSRMFYIVFVLFP